MESEKLICKDCNMEFTLNEGQRKFFEEKVAQDPQNWSMPKRCKKCRQKMKLNKEASKYPPTDYGL